MAEQNPISADNITGLILAGGQGSRMDGSDKGLVLYKGLPLIVHAIERLHAQVPQLIINANRNQGIYQGFGWPVVSDASNPQGETYAGPLAGVLAGLTACSTDWLLTAPCDSPCFPPDLAERFITTARQHPNQKLFVAGTEVQNHPVFMLVHRSLLDPLQGFIAAGERKMGFWQKQHAAMMVSFPEETAFANLNTPQELIDSEKQA